ncbi:galactose mutarotase-like protein [Gymnopilus junonius]|uniref:Galactose mutarotase-like protein n=1 Tax=Gymnopilus junonius TaxID=109634 RepID=A0A9P5NKR3_GYMJU|nr:galactose mutarotase-like protein [Gymnopilus junonius]
MSTADHVDSAFNVCEIKAPDGSIIAKFVPFGSTLTELYVKDKDGNLRNVVLGYDDNSLLLTDPAHPVFNGIVGRYAGRIKNGTFSIPILKNPKDGEPNVYHIPTNDHDGEFCQVTLHGGINGWDRRTWTLVERTPTSVTYKHVDNADEGFPGTVTAFATHSVSNGGILRTYVRASATEKTPSYVDPHIYWNLDAFQDGSDDILSHWFRLDASRNVLSVEENPFDFRKERQIGDKWDETSSVGYNAGWVLDDPGEKRPDGANAINGVCSLEIYTNQPAVVAYTSYWLNTPRKEMHGGPSVNYGPSSAVAIEQQGHIAAINTPEWGVDQMYYPERDYEWRSEYKFSIV